MPVARAALKLRKLRHRYGIGAAQVAVRPRLSWRGKMLLLAGALLIMLLTFAGGALYGRSLLPVVPGSGGEQLRALETELQALRAQAAASDSGMQIERSVQSQLMAQVRLLEASNAGLRQDLAFFEGLSAAGPAGGQAGVHINRLHVEADSVAGRYRFRVLLVNRAEKSLKPVRGGIQLQAAVRRGGKNDTISLDSGAVSGDAAKSFEITHFRRLEGVFSLPAGVELTGLEARLILNGEVADRHEATL